MNPTAQWTLAIVILSGAVWLEAFMAEAAVQCYVCSWQKPTPGVLEINDTCTHYHFQPEYASIVDCVEGCEAVTYRYSNKDDIIHFARNCLNTRNKQGGSDICYNKGDKSEYQSICTCTSNLCNGTTSISPMNWMLMITLAVSVLLAGAMREMSV